MVKIYINNKEVYVVADSTVLEACINTGFDLTRFCYHQRLSVAGNCRMCLVELEKAPKPIAACVFPVSSNMRVFTNTPLVKKARENILEFLLLHHPLDCPICDQGGECDLQDQTLFYGNSNSRTFEYKYSTEDKNCGPLIKTIMTRCIVCTRCVRFMSDIAGIEDFGSTNRGKNTEIGTYLLKILETELSANIIDICPVGALTSKNYAFVARPWELRSSESIDILDAFGSNIRIDFKESEIVRILPRLNEKINEEWITDKTRFSYDALKIQRLTTSLLRSKNGDLIPISWEHALLTLKKRLLKNKQSFCLLFNGITDLITLHKIKVFSNFFGINRFGFYKKYLVYTDFPENFSFSTKLDKLSSINFGLLIATNPRYEAFAFNLKLKKRIASGLFYVGAIGIPFNLTYKTSFWGIGSRTLILIAEGKHPLTKKLKFSILPKLFLGSSCTERSDFFGIENVLSFIRKSLKSPNSLCFVGQEANHFGGFFLGLNNQSYIKKEDSLILNGDSEKDDFYGKNIKNFMFFLGTHGNNFLLKTNIIIPIKAFIETSNIFINVLGFVQKVEKITNGPNIARENSTVIDSILLSKSMDSLNSKTVPLLFVDEKSEKCDFSKVILHNMKISHKFLIFRNPFLPKITDFYLSGALSKFSLSMAKCSNVYRKSFNNFFIA